MRFSYPPFYVQSVQIAFRPLILAEDGLTTRAIEGGCSIAAITTTDPADCAPPAHRD